MTSQLVLELPFVGLPAFPSLSILSASAIVSATLCSYLLSLFSFVAVVEAGKRQIDPDNILGPIASSAGDAACMVMYLYSVDISWTDREVDATVKQSER